MQKKHLKFNQKEESYQLFAILYFILQFYSTSSPEFTVLYICSFTFCWIHADPDP